MTCTASGSNELQCGRLYCYKWGPMWCTILMESYNGWFEERSLLDLNYDMSHYHSNTTKWINIPKGVPVHCMHTPLSPRHSETCPGFSRWSRPPCPPPPPACCSPCHLHQQRRLCPARLSQLSRWCYCLREHCHLAGSEERSSSLVQWLGIGSSH